MFNNLNLKKNKNKIVVINRNDLLHVHTKAILVYIFENHNVSQLTRRMSRVWARANINRHFTLRFVRFCIRDAAAISIFVIQTCIQIERNNLLGEKQPRLNKTPADFMFSFMPSGGLWSDIDKSIIVGLFFQRWKQIKCRNEK